MSNIITIHVTEDHISRGIPDTTMYCPVALALRGCTRLRPVEVNHGIVLARDHFIEYPDRAIADFVRSFEAGEPVEPFSFSLVLPEELPCEE